jgi:hypothetical protein
MERFPGRIEYSLQLRAVKHDCVGRLPPALTMGKPPRRGEQLDDVPMLKVPCVHGV